MRLPTSLLPVSEILSTSGCVHRASPSCPPGPVMTLSTPLGMPAWLASEAMISAESGVVEAGFNTSVLPITSACEIFHSAIMCGTFHGAIAAHTPIASRRIWFEPKA